MPAPSLVTFKLRFPEFGDGLDTPIQFWLDEVGAVLCEASFGTCYGEAVETLAAHKLALSQGRQAGAQSNGAGNVQIQAQGAVVSASADGLSVSFATTKAATSGSNREAYLSQTPYGVEYLSLRSRCLPRGRVAGCP